VYLVDVEIRAEEKYADGAKRVGKSEERERESGNVIS